LAFWLNLDSFLFSLFKNVDTSKFKAQLRDMDEKYVLTNSDVTRLKGENARLENELRGFDSKVPLSELERQIAMLTEETGQLRMRLNAAKSTNVKCVSKEEKKQVWLFKYRHEFIKCVFGLFCLCVLCVLHRFKKSTKSMRGSGAS
jgi:hypothetical protein